MNIITINREEYERLMDAVNSGNYDKDIRRIVEDEVYPLKEVVYRLININEENIGQVITAAVRQRDKFDIKFTVGNKRLVGFSKALVSSESESETLITMNMSVLPVNKNDRKAREILLEWTNTVINLHLVLALCMLNPGKVFGQDKTTEKKYIKHLTGRKELDDNIYHKLSVVSGCKLILERHGCGSAPTHEFDVRGHYRHLKNGKKVFVKPHTKCKGRGAKIVHEYIDIDMPLKNGGEASGQKDSEQVQEK